MRHDATVVVTTPCFPLHPIFWKLKPNTQLGAQTSSMRTTRPFNLCVDQLQALEPKLIRESRWIARECQQHKPKRWPKKSWPKCGSHLHAFKVHFGSMAIRDFFFPDPFSASHLRKSHLRTWDERCNQWTNKLLAFSGLAKLQVFMTSEGHGFLGLLSVLSSHGG